MQMTTSDWLILAGFLTLSLWIGLRVSRAAGSDFSSFFLAGRSQPWWLLGVSMVATTFSTDTPNLVADIVRRNGVLGNWTWWAFLLSGMLTVFLYAKLWRRSGVSTDVEFYEIRYSGKTAAFLRAFRGVYLGLLFNVLVMAAVTLAAIKIGSVMFGWSPVRTVVVAASVTLAYSALGGLRGVLLTDLVQFAMAMVGSVAATVHILRLPQVGGLEGLLANVHVRDKLAFWPSFESVGWSDLAPVFLIPLLVQWWASYYPGSEPGGGGYLVQRMLSAKNETHALGATLLFNLLHYGVRPWPWILVALASLVVFPGLEDIQQRFPHVPADVVRNDLAYPAMLTFLPPGLLGLVVTSLAAAYMSTMSTSVNWGSSILVSDVYRRFFRPRATERQLVWAGRLFTVALMALACAVSLVIESALGVFQILLQIGAGTGLLYLLRWFWWRINAATEVAAMVASISVALVMPLVGGGLDAWQQLLVGVALTTVCWLPCAYLAAPTDERRLVGFYRRIRPGGPGWAPVERMAGIAAGSFASQSLTVPLAASALGSVAIYGFVFATGYWLYGEASKAVAGLAVAGLAVVALVRVWDRHQD
jgi:Na+/proline symporter